ncbi:MAG: hypothetical protein QG670_588 [Thermoproteota archaeon]|nr:hypothetical protein [Thermoproteota archaeon]
MIRAMRAIALTSLLLTLLFGFVGITIKINAADTTSLLGISGYPTITPQIDGIISSMNAGTVKLFDLEHSNTIFLSNFVKNEN